MTRTLIWPDSPVVRDGMAVARALRSLGYEAAVVGGAVRDLHLGLAPKDLDLASNAPSEVILTGLPGARANAVALQHGTVTVPGIAGDVEVTRYRQEVACDGRHATVAPARRLEDDLARRDFTINAMAWRFTADGGQLEDPFGGAADLEARVLRAVGDPDQRLAEDALRVLRAYRFAAKYDLTIEPGLATALDRHADAVRTLSGPRRWMEWERFWSGSRGEGRVQGLRAMCANGACQAAWGGFAGLPEGIAAVARLTEEITPARALAVLWHREATEHVALWLDLLAPSGRDRRHVEQTHRLLQADILNATSGSERTSLRRLAATLPSDLSLVDFGVMAHATTAAASGDMWHASPARVEMWHAIDRATPRSAGGLDISGEVLLEMGIPRGPALGEMLGWLLQEVVAERVSNTPEALRAAVAERQCTSAEVTARSDGPAPSGRVR